MAVAILPFKDVSKAGGTTWRFFVRVCFEVIGNMTIKAIEVALY